MAIKEVATDLVVAKAGTSIGLFTTAVIFVDPAYTWMSIAGAFVGIGSALHTIYENKDVKFTKSQIVAILTKAFILGIIAMPSMFLAISEGVFAKMIGIELGEVSVSLAIVMAFGMSWYFTPILDAIVDRIRGKNDK